MGGDADDLVVPKKPARCCRVAVVLAQMHPVGVQLPGQFHVVVDDEGDCELCAERLQLRAEAGTCRPGRAPCGGTAGRKRPPERFPYPFQKVVPLVRHQVDSVR